MAREQVISSVRAPGHESFLTFLFNRLILQCPPVPPFQTSPTASVNRIQQNMGETANSWSMTDYFSWLNAINKSRKLSTLMDHDEKGFNHSWESRNLTPLSTEIFRVSVFLGSRRLIAIEGVIDVLLPFSLLEGRRFKSQHTDKFTCGELIGEGFHYIRRLKTRTNGRLWLLSLRTCRFGFVGIKSIVWSCRCYLDETETVLLGAESASSRSEFSSVAMVVVCSATRCLIRWRIPSVGSRSGSEISSFHTESATQVFSLSRHISGCSSFIIRSPSKVIVLANGVYVMILNEFSKKIEWDALSNDQYMREHELKVSTITFVTQRLSCSFLDSYMCSRNRHGERRQRPVIHELRLDVVKSNSIPIFIQMASTNMFQMHYAWRPHGKMIGWKEKCSFLTNWAMVFLAAFFFFR